MGAGLLRTQAELEGGADHGVAAQGRGPAFAINYTFTDILPICKAGNANAIRYEYIAGRSRLPT